MIEPEHPRLSIVRQCALLSISRSHYYGPVRGESAENLGLMRVIDAQFLETPWYGSRQMARHLRRQVKYECVYTRAFETGSEARAGIGRWIDHYNADRPHAALGGRTPNEAYQREPENEKLAA